MSAFTEKHSNYFEILTQISYWIAGILSVLKLIELVMNQVSDQNLVGLLAVFLFASFFTMIWGFVYFLAIYAILFVISIAPYLIYRGIKS